LSATNTHQDASNFAAAASNFATSAQQAAAAHSLQSTAAHQNVSTMVFNDLSALNSHHLVLTVNFTSNQAHNLMNLYQGSFGQVTSQASFPIGGLACGGCGAGVCGVGGPGPGPYWDPPAGGAQAQGVAKPEE
jgi:hypothetical protein